MKKFYLKVQNGVHRHVDFVEELEASTFEEAVEKAKHIFKHHDVFIDVIANFDEDDPPYSDMKILVVTEELPLELDSWFIEEQDRGKLRRKERAKQQEKETYERLKKKFEK